MKIRSILAVAVVLIGLAMLLAPGIVRAQATNVRGVCDDPKAADSSFCTATDANNITGSEKDGILIRAVKVLVLVAAIIAVFMMLVASVTYVTANGDSAKMSRAKDTILFAVIGIVIAGLGQFFVVFVASRLQ